MNLPPTTEHLNIVISILTANEILNYFNSTILARNNEYIKSMLNIFN